MRIKLLWIPLIFFLFSFFERGALTTLFGVTKPPMDDYTKIHPKLYTFIPNLTLHPMKRPAKHDSSILKIIDYQDIAGLKINGGFSTIPKNAARNGKQPRY